MSSQFQPTYCVEGMLPEVTEGQFYITTDTNRVFADLDGIRVSVSEFILVDSEANLPIIPIRGKLYIALAERSLWIYSAGWINLQIPKKATETTLGGVKIDNNSIKMNEDGVISTSINDLITDEQLAVLNSGITLDKIRKYDEIIASLEQPST